MTTKFHFIRTLVLFAVVVSLISGCAAKGPSYTSVKATIPQLQSDKARLYFLREKTHMAGTIAASIQVNGIKVADLYSGGFTYLDQSSDNVSIVIDAFMNPLGGKWTGAFPLENGKEYYFFVTPNPNKILATALFSIAGAIVTEGGPFHAYHIPKKMALKKLQTMKFADKKIDSIWTGVIDEDVIDAFVNPPECPLCGNRPWAAFLRAGTASDETKYVDEFKDALPHGQGTGTASDGTKYVDEFKDGLPHGQGTGTASDGTKYVGGLPPCEGSYGDSTWANCFGTLTYSDGDKYVGEFKDGKPHGQGIYTSPNGVKYVGEYKDGLPHGQGTFTDPDGQKYVGEWKNHKRHGKGTYTWPDGAKYVGEWKDGEKHGQGTKTHADGAKYVGGWKNNKLHGQGTLTVPDGTKYVGEYKDGKAHGKGTLTSADGSVQKGTWRDDEFLE